jgi:hypothetical protein
MSDVFDRQSRSGPHSYAVETNYVTIVGVRAQANWRFFAQTYSQGPNRLLSVESLAV